MSHEKTPDSHLREPNIHDIDEAKKNITKLNDSLDSSREVKRVTSTPAFGRQKTKGRVNLEFQQKF